MMRFLPRRRIDREWKSSGIGQTVTKVTVTGQWAGSNASPSVGQPLYVALYNIIMNPIVTVCYMPCPRHSQAEKGHKRTALLRRRVRYGRLDLAGYQVGSGLFRIWLNRFRSPTSSSSLLCSVCKRCGHCEKDNANQCWRVSEMMFYSRKVLLKVPSESQLVLRWDECRSFHVPKSDDQVAVNCVFLWSWRIPRDFDNDRSSSIKAEETMTTTRPHNPHLTKTCSVSMDCCPEGEMRRVVDSLLTRFMWDEG